MSINDIYTIGMYYEYEFCRAVVIILLIVFLVIAIIDILKWRYYGKK